MNSRVERNLHILSELETRCRERGLPVTWQRRAVLQALAERGDHPTADELYEGLRVRVPGLSRTTVYRVLETLVTLGLAGRAAHPDAAGRFDAETGPHHHFLCERCGRLVDLEADLVPPLPGPARLPEGFEIHSASVYYRGRCADCRRAPEAGAPQDLYRKPRKRRSRS